MSAQAVLFDAPGPKARLRHNILTVVGLLLLVGVLVLVVQRLGTAQQLLPHMWLTFLDPQTWISYLIPGLIGTVQATIISVILASIFGVFFGMGRLSEVRALRWICGIVVEFFRAVPVLIMMYFAFSVYSRNGVFLSTINPLAAVVTALTLYNGSVIAELVRSGVHSLPKGQSEAGLSIGLTPGQVLSSIQLPQALTAMLPALIGQLVVVLKDSALGYGITYLELLNWSKTLGSARANTVPAYIVAALLFILINWSLTRLASAVEARLRKSKSTVAPIGGAAAILPGAAVAVDAAADGDSAGT